MLIALRERLNHIGVELFFDEGVAEYIAIKGEEIGFGARPISRLIVSEIENKITDILLNNKYENLKIFIRLTKDELTFESKHQEALANNA